MALQDEIAMVSWWEMSEEKIREIMDRRRCHQDHVNEAIKQQYRDYIKKLNDARWSARRLAGCSDAEIMRIVLEAKVPLAVILKEIQRHNDALESTAKDTSEEYVPEGEKMGRNRNSGGNKLPTVVPKARDWSAREEQQLAALVAKFGNDWDAVASNMDRSRGAVSVHWCMMKKRAREED